MGNWDMQLLYMQEVYKKLDRLGENQDKETWLVKSNIDKKLYVWKEIELEMVGVYQKLKLISSKNLAAVLELVRIGDRIIVIEEYISGDTLKELIESRRIEEEMAVNITRQLLEALSVLHGQNIVHRDINPQNVLLSTDGVVKLLDFGIAREPKAGQGRDTTILGTAGYAAPEQFGFQQTDGRSDIYSLGVLFHVMLTGRLPEGNVCCHPRYQNFIWKCIALEPGQRYQSALEACRDLEAGREAWERTEKNNMEGSAYSKKETAAGAEKPKVNPYIPVGFRSKVFWKQFLACSFYIMMGIYFVGEAVEFAVTPASFFLELAALTLYLVLAFVCLTNYGDWFHRMRLFSKMKKEWEMFVRIVLFCIIFECGYELENYVKVVMLGLEK